MRIIHVVSTFPPYRGGQGNVAREMAERTVARGHDVVVVVTPRRGIRNQSSEGGSASGGESGIRNPEIRDSRFEIRTPRPLARFGNAAWCPGIRRALEVIQPDLVHLHWPFIGGIAPVIAWRRSASLPLSAPRGEGESRGKLGIPAFFHLETSGLEGERWRSATERTSPSPTLPLPSAERRERGFGGRRLVVQYHMDLIGEGWRGALFAAYQRRALPRVLAAADRVVVSSLDYARHGALAPFVAQLGDRLVEIPLGVDVERFGAAAGQQGSRAAGLRVLFVGGLDRAHAFKGVDVLLAAVARLTDSHRSNTDGHGCHGYRLRIVGNGELRSTYEAQARDLGISDRVEFLGSVSDAELPGIYRNADVLILPSTSRSEAFGVVLLEACAAGIPVIASDLPGVRTVVVDGETGFLVPPGDVAALAQRLTMLARDPEKMRGMGAAARRRMEERYVWGRIMEQWVACYRSL